MISTDTNKSRIKKGILASVAGILLNVLLGCIKIIGGVITGSVSFITDAVNNFADSLSGAVTGISFALSGRKADREHPYGHGRYEYVAGLIVGLLIIFAGFQFIIESAKRIFSPSSVTFTTMGIWILAISVAVKAGMFVFYRLVSKRLDSSALKAAATDSLSDCLVTAAVGATFVISYFFPQLSFGIDGVCGALVSIVIIFNGAKIVLSTVNKLLGNGSDLILSENVYDLVCSDPLIIGAHDLTLHDYGPSKGIGSVHAEFDRNLSIIEAHSIIDRLEKRAFDELGIELVIHVDPVDISNPDINRLRQNLKTILKFYSASAHELGVDNESKAVYFHVKLPLRYEKLTEQVIRTLTAAALKDFVDYTANIVVDIVK